MAAIAITSALVAPAALACANVNKASVPATVSGLGSSKLPLRQQVSFGQRVNAQVGTSRARVVCVAGDVSSSGTTYLIAGAVAIALVGSAFPLIFSRKDTCPECGGAGFVRGSGAGGKLVGNAARKDQQQIVCQTCKGLGKLGQTDKAGKY
eukprot:jgi/Mesen1/6782/ME000348S06056